MYILIWDPQRRPDFKKAIFSHFQLHCLDNLKREHCVCYRDATLTTDSPSSLFSSLSVRYPCYLVCFLALEGVQVNCPQQHSVADHIRCYFFWCETHSIKTHQSFPWSIFWRDTKGAAVLYQLGGVDELGWCVLPLMGSPKRIYIKAWGKNSVCCCSTAHGKRGMSCSSTRYMRSTEALGWWIPQYCAFVGACIHPPVIYSVVRRKKVCPSIHIHPCALSHYMYLILPLSPLYFSPEMYLSLLVIGRVKLCGKTAQMIPPISVATVETFIIFSIFWIPTYNWCYLFLYTFSVIL